MAYITTIGEVVSIAGGINSITGGGITNALGMGPKSQSGTQAQTAGDPFSPYRANLAAMYNGALTGGNQTDPTQMPGYSAWQSGVLNPAMEASKRSSAASGMMNSGNEQIALNNTAQQGYYGFMTNYMNQLAQGSGAVNNPVQAAGLGTAQGNANMNNQQAGIGAIGQGLSGLVGSSGGNVDMTGFQTPYQAPTYSPSTTSAPAWSPMTTDPSGGVGISGSSFPLQ